MRLGSMVKHLISIELTGVEGFLADIKDDLETGRYKPHPELPGGHP